ncbi:MAG TPA: glycosyl hydrolase family 79 C-terminal domain-containing protein [Solirubrobacteraceae bacterium]|nr:glycosyl hydrolase family 79 C-terminal domain-containing protein [Solirubrobacteraceae bacterium]
MLAALTAALLALTVVVLGDFDSGSAGAQPTTPTVSASVGSTPAGQPLAPGFLGVSLEFSALHQYTGRDPRAVNPVLIQLLRALVPGQAPVLRIGGNSADTTWWPQRGLIPPGGVNYRLTEGWVQTTKALASALRAKLILGVNLAGGRPAVAAAEARALLGGIGRRYIQALEIGNEPDLYSVFPWYRDRRGRLFYARDHSYGLSDFISQFTRWRAALGKSTPVTGPAFAELNWLSGLGTFVSAEPGLKVVTIHRYPLHGCLNDKTSPSYASAANLLNDSSSSGLAQAIAPYVSQAHSQGVQFRLDEMNSASYASCLGRKGVSGTFASALWVLDTLFNLQNVGVDGVNIHSLPRAAYELFTFKYVRGHWQAFVHPEYYGMLMFAQAFPAGAQLVPVNVNPNGPVKVWATRAPDGKTRVVVINKDPTNSYQLQLQVAGMSGPAELERLQASSASATNGVTLGGQTFGDETTTGTLGGTRQTEPLVPLLGTYTFTVPAASAAMLSPSNGSGGGAP